MSKSNSNAIVALAGVALLSVGIICFGVFTYTSGMAPTGDTIPVDQDIKTSQEET